MNAIQLGANSPCLPLTTTVSPVQQPTVQTASPKASDTSFHSKKNRRTSHLKKTNKAIYLNQLFIMGSIITGSLLTLLALIKHKELKQWFKIKPTETPVVPTVVDETLGKPPVAPTTQLSTSITNPPHPPSSSKPLPTNSTNPNKKEGKSKRLATVIALFFAIPGVGMALNHFFNTASIITTTVETATKTAIKPTDTTKIKAVWHRPEELSQQAVYNKIKAFQAMGLNTVMVETVFRGRTLFPSKTYENYGIAPNQYALAGLPTGADPLRWWVEAAQQINKESVENAQKNPSAKAVEPFKVHAWVQVFYTGNATTTELPPEGPILKKFPQWANKPFNPAKNNNSQLTPSSLEPGYFYLDPANTEVRLFIRKLVLEIAENYKPDGIQLDYIRYPNSKPEDPLTTWGYTQVAIKQFQSENKGLSPLDAVTGDDQNRKQWEAFKTKQVNAMVQEIAQELMLHRQQGLMLSAAIFPEQENALVSKHQDWATWAQANQTDCLFHMSSTESLREYKADIQQVKKASPQCTVAGSYAPYQKTNADWLGRQLDEVREQGIRGFALFGSAGITPAMQETLKAKDKDKDGGI
jgi:uncharacterized lipoprotein YddW (UPF0748 family)